VNNIRDEKYLKAFGEHVKKLRLRKKLSRETLAVHSNIETMQALAKGLEIHPKKLFDFDV